MRVLDGLDGLLRSRSLALVAAAGGVAALALLAPGWFAEPIKTPQATAFTTAADEASERALAGRLAPLNIWTAQAPFVHRPMGASAPDEESATPVTLGPNPVAAGPELGVMEPEIERVLRDPGGFLEELSQMPLAERDQQLSTLRGGRRCARAERPRSWRSCAPRAIAGRMRSWTDSSAHRAPPPRPDRRRPAARHRARRPVGCSFPRLRSALSEDATLLVRPWKAAALLVFLIGVSANAGAETVQLVPESGASWGLRNVLAPFSVIFVGPSYWYGERTLKVDTTPPGAQLDLFYVRANFQKRYEQAQAPVTIELPTRIEAGPATR